uniref:Uncharacterized protein n=1 Tax=Anguilla anguilla TaxID=7936 RepID=A0A0E9QWU8_ANGAN
MIQCLSRVNNVIFVGYVIHPLSRN